VEESLGCNTSTVRNEIYCKIKREYSLRLVVIWNERIIFWKSVMFLLWIKWLWISFIRKWRHKERPFIMKWHCVDLFTWILRLICMTCGARWNWSIGEIPSILRRIRLDVAPSSRRRV
jgi:hypothetical protein